MARLCSRCGAAMPDGVRTCPRCGAGRARSGSKRTRQRERERKTREPYRAGYGREYQRARQKALDRTGGRSAISGKVIAKRDGKGRWRMLPCGAVHHIVELRNGGTNDSTNRLPVTKAEHDLIHRDQRRRERERRREQGI